MLDISTSKLIRVIALVRETAADNPHVMEYIGSFNADEQASLVAIYWVGRETFSPEDVADALRTAREEATAPTEDYLSGEPELADFLEAGMEALGLDVTEEESAL